MKSEISQLLPLLWAFGVVFFSLYKRLKATTSATMKNVYTGYAIASIVFIVVQIAALHFGWVIPWK